jgi:hypothetical protein
MALVGSPDRSPVSVTLLWSVSTHDRLKLSVYLACDEPLQATSDFPSTLALGCPAFDVGTGFRIVEHSHPDDDVGQAAVIRA